MTQSFYTAIGGMNAGQTKISVVADNIANMNTIGFKASKVNFSDVYYRTSSFGKAPTSAGSGGINPKQIGVGVQTASIARDFSAGTTLSTGLNTDLCINGSSFFTVMSATDGILFTRDGNFNVDSNGNLVTANGDKVLGTASMLGTSSSETPIKIPTYITTVTSPATIDQLNTKRLNELNGVLSGGVTGGAFTITSIDDAGKRTNHVINVTPDMTVEGLVNAVTAQAGGAYTVAVNDNGQLSFEPDGDAVNLEFTNGNLDDPDAAKSNFATVLGFGSANEDGTYTSQVMHYHQTVGSGTLSDLNSENYTQLTIDENGIIEVTYGNNDKLSVMQDPNNPEKMIFQYTLNSGIVIYGDDLTINDGLVEPANLQIQLASFVNPNGLIAEGSNTYSAGPNSGMALYGSISSNAFGNVSSGVLEGSNVDLATEFAEMVVAQRAIEANSRVFDTTSQILQTLGQLGR